MNGNSFVLSVLKWIKFIGIFVLHVDTTEFGGTKMAAGSSHRISKDTLLSMRASFVVPNRQPFFRPRKTGVVPKFDDKYTNTSIRRILTTRTSITRLPSGRIRINQDDGRNFHHYLQCKHSLVSVDMRLWLFCLL